MNTYIQAGRRTNKTKNLLMDLLLKITFEKGLNKKYAVITNRHTLKYTQNFFHELSKEFYGDDRKISQVDFIWKTYGLKDYDYIYLDDADDVAPSVLQDVIDSGVEHYIVGTPHGANVDFYELLRDNPHYHFPCSYCNLSEEEYNKLKVNMSADTITNELMGQYTTEQIEYFEKALHERISR